MKHLYFFLGLFFVSCFGFAQLERIQVVLYDYQFSTEILDDLSASYNIVSTFNNYNFPSLELSNRTHIIECDGCDTSALTQDLLGYTEDVEAVYPIISENFYNGLLIYVLASDIVVPNTSSTSGNGTVITSDIGVNQIFENHNVYQSNELGDSDGIWPGVYGIGCDCNATLLRDELIAYEGISIGVEFVNIYNVLSNYEFTFPKVSIHPNPFKDKISLEINKPIESIEIYDILGKSIYKSNSVSEIENYSSTLKSGVYLLKIMTKNGEAVTKKLVKS